MTEQEELLKLIDGHIDSFDLGLTDYAHGYSYGMRSIRWLVYNFFNAPRKEQTTNDQQDFGL